MNSKLKNLLESTSLPGVSLIVKSRHSIVKIVWFLCILLLSGVSICFVIESVRTYYNYEVVTNIHIISEPKSLFPTITFCMNLSDSNHNQTIDFNAVIIECFFEQINCSAKDFYIFKDPFNLTCYRFNSETNSLNQSMRLKNSTRNGKYSGLSVIFNANNSSYLDNFESKVKFYVNNASNLFMPIRSYYQDNYIFLARGGNSIQIEREFVQRLAEPHNNCIKQDKNTPYVSEFYEYFVRKNKTYLQKDCFDLCIWEKVKQICNCTDMLGDYSECLKYAFSCVVTSINSLRPNNIPPKCVETCPEECDFIIYKTYRSYLGLINEDAFSDMPLGLKENLISLNVYYPRLEYTLVNQIAKMSEFDLVSLAGGTLGLFIGFSFFTLVEMIQICLELIVNYLSKKVKKVHVIPVESSLKINQIRKLTLRREFTS